MSRRVRFAARVTGRVQGVGFRYFTRQAARSLDLSGWVRNEPDGSVRLEVEGRSEDVDRFLDAVRQGPPAARVRDLDAVPMPETGESGPFSTRR